MSSDTGVDPTTRSAVPDPGAADGSRAAAHLLEMAARDAEQWRVDARKEAEAVVGDARAEAARLVEAGREEAQRLTVHAHAEAATVRAQLETERRRHEAEVAQLQRLEDGYRDRVRSHLNELLAQVDAPSSTDHD